MNFLLPFFGGVLLGWLAEWVIDWLYWRDRRATETGRLAQSDAELRRLRQAGDDSSQLRHKLAQAEAEISRLQAQLAAQANTGATTRSVIIRDPLEKINGIGPVFARKLNAAQVNTFADLANLTPQRIYEIIQPQSWQKIEPADWIVQAKTLAQPPATDKESTL